MQRRQFSLKSIFALTAIVAVFCAVCCAFRLFFYVGATLFVQVLIFSLLAGAILGLNVLLAVWLPAAVRIFRRTKDESK